MILAVDVGATSIRSGWFDDTGTLVGPKSRRSTPYPCRPDRLVAVVARLAARGEATAVGLGFPGEVRDGVVVDAANLTRPGGTSTERDVELASLWHEFHLADAVAAACGVPVAVRNDAAMAALGCLEGRGVELVVTLGTGCGLALARDGRLVDVRDVGDESLRGSATYDQVLGEQGRRADPDGWRRHVVAAVSALAREFEATSIHLAGGNARRLSRHDFGAWGASLTIEWDDPALKGAWVAVRDHLNSPSV